MSSNIEFLPSVAGNITDVIEKNKTLGWPDVSAQAKVFVHKYAEAGNLGEACKEVNISRAKGSRMLRDPLVSSYLDHLYEDLRDITIINKQFVELEMLDALDKLSGRVDVPNVTKDGDVVWAPRFNGAGLVSLLKEMKHNAGMHKDTEATSGVTVNINMADFTGVTVEGEVVSNNPSE